MHKRQRGLFMAVTVIVLLSGAMEGCVVGGDTYVREEPFTEKQVKNIHNGETTRKEILRWFGPPQKVARPRSGSTDGLFKNFEVSLMRLQAPLIYYYKSSEDSQPQVGLATVGAVAVGHSYTEKKLWILIDENNGVVVDYLFEKTVNGEPKLGATHKSGPNTPGVGILGIP